MAATTAPAATASPLKAIGGIFIGLWGAIRALARNRVGLLGLIGLGTILFITFILPHFIPLDDKVKVDQIYAPPSWQHPFGFDSQGRDVWTQIIHGGQQLLLIAFGAAVVSTLLGAGLGGFSGVMGGKVDSFLMLLTDVWLTIPLLPLLIVLAAFIRVNSPLVLIVVIGLLSWAGLTRAVRSQVLSIKQRDFVEAARVLNLGTGHIVFREVLPNMMSYITINFILAITAAVFFQTALVFLGLVPVSTNDWGVMIRFAYTRGAIFSKDSFWYIMAPVLAIALFQLSLVALERGIAEVFNPRLRA